MMRGCDGGLAINGGCVLWGGWGGKTIQRIWHGLAEETWVEFEGGPGQGSHNARPDTGSYLAFLALCGWLWLLP